MADDSAVITLIADGLVQRMELFTVYAAMRSSGGMAAQRRDAHEYLDALLDRFMKQAEGAVAKP